MTPFGKALRHLRVEREMLLGELAASLAVGSSYLSQVETGKKPIPTDFVTRICAVMKLTSSEREELRNAAALSSSEFRFQINQSAPASDRILAGELAHEFARLTPDAKAQIARIVRGARDD